MSLLRQRMLDDLRLRNYAIRTQDSYIWSVARFARHYGRSPEELGPEEIRAYLLHLTEERGLSPSTLRIAIAALRFLYSVTLQRHWELHVVLPFPRRERKLPVVLSRGEVARLIGATRSLRDRSLVMTAYATGVRVSELVHLEVAHIDGERKVIRIHHGKGAKDRVGLLPPDLHHTLRDYWRQCRPDRWLFPGAKSGRPLSVSAVQKIFQLTGARAKIQKRVTPHCLRHSFATHLCEDGVDLVTLRDLLGHSNLQTVQIYTHIADPSLDGKRSLDLLGGLDLDPR